MSYFGDQEAEVHFQAIDALQERLDLAMEKVDNMLKELYHIKKDIEKLSPATKKELLEQINQIKRMEFPN